MRVGIAGAGAIAMGYAALLLKNGHSVSVWSPSGASTEALAEGAPLKVSGAIEGDFHPIICNNAETLAQSDIIVLALPAYGHRFVVDSLTPHIKARHTIIISGHLSFAALYLSKRLAEHGVQIPIIAWSTTALTGRARSPTEFNVGSIRAKVDMATVPVHMAEAGETTCVALFGDRFEVKDDILSIALGNLNPQSHLGIALCNLTRIERGEAWGQNTNITPSVRRFLNALDRERIAIAEALGKSVRTASDYSRLSQSSSAQAQSHAAPKSETMGPTDLNTRYVLEDVPFGLIPTLNLAKLAGVAAPLHQSGVDILNACYGLNLAERNDILAEIGPITRAALEKLVIDGYPTTASNL